MSTRHCHPNAAGPWHLRRALGITEDRSLPQNTLVGTVGATQSRTAQLTHKPSGTKNTHACSHNDPHIMDLLDAQVERRTHKALYCVVEVSSLHT